MFLNTKGFTEKPKPCEVLYSKLAAKHANMKEMSHNRKTEKNKND